MQVEFSGTGPFPSLDLIHPCIHFCSRTNKQIVIEIPAIPAIANAVYDAVGVRIDKLPFSPMKVLEKLQQQKEGGDVTD